MNKKINYHKIYNIPRKIFIFGHTINIIFDENLAKDKGFTGLSEYNKELITLQPNCLQYERTKESIITTYWHEIFHFIFKFIGYEELANDEELIPQIALTLHQIISTAKY